MSSNQQNLTIGSIRLKSDYWVIKISLTTGLGSYPSNCDTQNTSSECPSSCLARQNELVWLGVWGELACVQGHEWSQRRAWSILEGRQEEVVP